MTELDEARIVYRKLTDQDKFQRAIRESEPDPDDLKGRIEKLEDRLREWDETLDNLPLILNAMSPEGTFFYMGKKKAKKP